MILRVSGNSSYTGDWINVRISECLRLKTGRSCLVVCVSAVVSHTKKGPFKMSARLCQDNHGAVIDFLGSREVSVADSVSGTPVNEAGFCGETGRSNLNPRDYRGRFEELSCAFLRRRPSLKGDCELSCDPLTTLGQKIPAHFLQLER